MPEQLKQILVIDDSKETRELIANALESSDFKVLTASGGREGMRTALARQPDLILLDMEMPVIDGLATCRTLKRNPKTKSIPVIFLTARKESKEVVSAIQAGGVDYVVKPFDLDDLLARMRKVLDSQGFDPSAVVRLE